MMYDAWWVTRIAVAHWRLKMWTRGRGHWTGITLVANWEITRRSSCPTPQTDAEMDIAVWYLLVKQYFTNSHEIFSSNIMQFIHAQFQDESDDRRPSVHRWTPKSRFTRQSSRLGPWAMTVLISIPHTSLQSKWPQGLKGQTSDLSESINRHYYDRPDNRTRKTGDMSFRILLSIVSTEQTGQRWVRESW
jgi:hypothetical protein